MPLHLDHLKRAEAEQQLLLQALPDLPGTLDQQLRKTFPKLAQGSCTDDMFITSLDDAQVGQTPMIISRTLSDVFEEYFESRITPTFDERSAGIVSTPYSLRETDRVQGITIPLFETFLEQTAQHLEVIYKQQVLAFWDAGDEKTLNPSPRSWLTEHVRTCVSNEANVRRQDNTLPEAAFSMVLQLTAGNSGALNTYRVALKGAISALDSELSGLFIIAHPDSVVLATTSPHFNHLVQAPVDHSSSAQAQQPVVLFMPSSGLEVFTSFDALNQELNERFKDDLQRKALLDLMPAAHHSRTTAMQGFGYQVITGSVFSDRVSSIIEKQQLDISHAWRGIRQASLDRDLEAIGIRIDRILGQSLLVRPAQILKARYTRLIESCLPTWLSNGSEPDKTQWRLAMEAFKNAASDAHVPGEIALNRIGQRSQLLTFAKDALKKQVKADLNIEINPDRIMISTTEAVSTGPVIYPFATSGYTAANSLHRTGPTVSYIETRRSLSAVALDNVGKLNLTFALTARVLGENSQTHPTLTPVYVKAMVRQLNVGRLFQTHLRHTLLESPAAQWRKERYVALKTALLRVDLVEGTLSRQLTPLTAAWMKALLDRPAQSDDRLVEGKKIFVSQLLLKNRPLPGVFVISQHLSTTRVCYTPQAPDNIWFREFTDLESLGTALAQTTLHPYILQRVSEINRPYIGPLLKTGSIASQLSHPLSIQEHFLEQAYQIEALFAIRNANEQSITTQESNVATVIETLDTLLDLVSFVLPFKIMLPVAILRFLYSINLGLDALSRDEQQQALLHFMGSIAHLTDGASDFAGSAVFAKSIRQRPPRPTLSLNHLQASARTTNGMTLRTGERFQDGIYEFTPAGSSEPLQYVKSPDGHLYRTHYDTLDNRWLIADERQPNANHGYPVRSLGAGDWELDLQLNRGSKPTAIEALIEASAVTDVSLSGIAADNNGIFTVNHRTYIQQSSRTFQVHFDWSGRHWRLNTQGRLTQGSDTHHAVRRHLSDTYWEVKRINVAGESSWQPLTLVRPVFKTSDSPTFSGHDLRAEHKQAIAHLNNRYRGLETGSPASAKFTAELDAFNAQRIALHEEAKAFLKTFTGTTRPSLPDFLASIPHPDMLKKIFKDFTGMVIGEVHSAIGSKQFLITHMDELASNKVKTLYMEHLQTDFHQADLDDFFNSGKMSDSLNDFLHKLDYSHNTDPGGRYTFRNLVLEAQKRGIRVKAIDCAASYLSKGLAQVDGLQPRLERFSWFSTRAIQANQIKNGNQNWVALVGSTHSNTFKGIPGIAEIENALGVRIDDVAPGTGRGWSRDKGIVTANVANTAENYLLRTDLNLTMEVPASRYILKSYTPAQLNTLLKTPDLYVFDNYLPQGPTLIHRAPDQALVYTVLQLDGSKIYLDIPSLPGIHQQRFDDVPMLMERLRALNMRLAH
ncbi:membrane-targeted effector domain-containing toxin [Pseudomonas sp. SIMBA_077]